MPIAARQIDSTIDVVTPENISFQYELAGPFRRLPAFFIDLGIRFAIWVGFLIIVSIFGLFAGGGGASALGTSLFLLLWFVLEWFYGGLLETFWNGQTVGKRLLGMRVLRIDGQPINGLQAVMRNVLRAVDLMPLVPVGLWFGQPEMYALPTGMIGLITPVLNSRYQRLGDLVCGTMVIVEERRWLMTVTKIEERNVRALVEALPASFVVTPKLSQSLAAYVERRKYLSVPRRAEIARHLGEPLVERFRWPADTNHDQLLCAIYYRTFITPPTEAPVVPPPVVEATATSGDSQTGSLPVNDAIVEA